MKNITKILLISMLGAVFLFAQNSESLKKYDELFDSLSKQRKGLSDQQIKNSVDPFIQVRQTYVVDPQTGEESVVKTDAPKPEYVLYAVLNKRAKINDQWYKIGDQVKDYTLSYISADSVSLSKNNKVALKLELKKGNENVLIKQN